MHDSIGRAPLMHSIAAKNGSFSHQQSARKTRYVSRHFCHGYLKANKVSKSKGTRKAARISCLKVCWCCLPKINKKNFSLCLWKLYSLPKFARFWDTVYLTLKHKFEQYLVTRKFRLQLLFKVPLPHPLYFPGSLQSLRPNSYFQQYGYGAFTVSGFSLTLVYDELIRRLQSVQNAAARLVTGT